MGHSLVTKFDEQGLKVLHQIMDPFQSNKIPYGRNCDREKANSALDYHVTVFHWARSQDELYLKGLTGFAAPPCQIEITGIDTLHTEEGSLLLYLAARPAEDFSKLTETLESRLCVSCSGFLHITLAVSKKPEEIAFIHRHIQKTVRFPFKMNVVGLDLYHIWNPTEWVCTF